MYKHFLLSFLLCASAYGQPDTNSVTVTASRTLTTAPDQAFFSVQVATSAEATLADVISILQSAGVSSATFQGVSSLTSSGISTIVLTPPSSVAPQLSWSFTFLTPLSKLKQTTTALTSAQQTITQKKNGTALNFSVQGTGYSPELQQAQNCSLADLLADARSQAQTLAAAAGRSVGNVLSLSRAVASTVPSRTSVAGAPDGFLVADARFLSSAGCSLTVKFGLGQ